MRVTALPRSTFALFDYGFRPFFLLAGWHAVLSIPVWLWLYRGGTSPLAAMPPQLWHGHEMLFGFVGAAIAGFMLTAVPSWTGSRGFGGVPLALLTATWILGRAAFALAGYIPIAVLAFAELAFVPGLLLLVGPPVMRSRNRNQPLLLVLTVFWCLDAAFLWALWHAEAALARQFLLATLGLVLLLITVIGGRIIPAFTGNAFRARGLNVSLRSRPQVDRLTIAAMAAIVLADAAFVPATIPAAIAAVAALLHVIRASGWQTWRTTRDPIVWILHVAYLWLPVGLALRALSTLCNFGFAAHWIHALGAGAAATMVLAVMTRAALGHTGRPLRVALPIVGAYGLLVVAGLVRVFGPAALPLSYQATIAIATIAWTAAFLSFVCVYTPILLQPRADGKRG